MEGVHLLNGRFFSFVTILIISLLVAPITGNAESSTNTPENGNDYPIILVHGLGGWGEGEMFDIKYWGGEHDTEAFLNDNEHETYAATVSPVASNWDRAVELYHYIYGGEVDYGAAHAEEHGHDRYGRTYPGIYSEWDNENKIHLVGHSMGGQTIRTMTELVKNGSAEEIEYYENNPDEGISPLFEGGKDWVHSITSVATPHNGSTFADEDELVPFIKEMVIHFASAAGVSQDHLVYDFKMDHWGLKRKDDERFSTYMDRVMNSSIWGSDDISAYDLSTKGADELNQWVDLQSDIYYFSYTGNATYRAPSGKYQPLVSMNPFMWGSSVHIGSYTREDSEPIIDESWWPNDGLVNVNSSKFPAEQENKSYDDNNVEKGVWNFHDEQYGWDHLDFIGLSLEHGVGLREINDMYLDMAEQLHDLPK